MAKQPSFNLEWDAHEYEHKVRSRDWFWAVGIVAVSLAVVAVILNDIIFGILILVSALALSLFINRPPETIRVIVDEKGITRGKVRYPYDTLRSFWVDEEHPHRKIILRSKKMFMPLIVVPLGPDIDGDRLTKTLLAYLPEEFHSLPLAEKVLEWLGF